LTSRTAARPRAVRGLGRGAPESRVVNAIQRHRDEYCLLVWAAGFGIAALRHAPATNLLTWNPFWPAAACWVALLAGVALRVWAAANLEKNRFTRPTGPYALMRHPLYAGTLLISLGWFASIGLPVSGALLWIAMLVGIFLPVLRKEERELEAEYPAAYGRYLRQVPALWPKVSAIPASLATSGFTVARADRNFGLRALWFVLLVPLLSAALAWVQRP
jgi:protein-S-isoprenylcysteine O-methyltransferase Ste14